MAPRPRPRVRPGPPEPPPARAARRDHLVHRTGIRPRHHRGAARAVPAADPDRPGGSGKTRLALRGAARRCRHPGGSGWWSWPS
jgi:hypothetical protein